MIYTAFTLNGSWEMQYQETKYTDVKNPWQGGALVENAVPGYWEDMTERFLTTPFFKRNNYLVERSDAKWSTIVILA